MKVSRLQGGVKQGAALPGNQANRRARIGDESGLGQGWRPSRHPDVPEDGTRKSSPGQSGPLCAGLRSAVTRLVPATASGIDPRPVVVVRLAAGASVEMAALTPALLATLRHAASMPNPAFYERQRRRHSTWGVLRFLHSFDETLDGRLVLSRGLADLLVRITTPSGPTVMV